MCPSCEWCHFTLTTTLGDEYNFNPILQRRKLRHTGHLGNFLNAIHLVSRKVETQISIYIVQSSLHDHQTLLHLTACVQLYNNDNRWPHLWVGCRPLSFSDTPTWAHQRRALPQGPITPWNFLATLAHIPVNRNQPCCHQHIIKCTLWALPDISPASFVVKQSIQQAFILFPSAQLSKVTLATKSHPEQ